MSVDVRKRIARRVQNFLWNRKSAEQVADDILAMPELAHALTDCPLARTLRAYDAAIAYGDAILAQSDAPTPPLSHPMTTESPHDLSHG